MRGIIRTGPLRQQPHVGVLRDLLNETGLRKPLRLVNSGSTNAGIDLHAPRQRGRSIAPHTPLVNAVENRRQTMSQRLFRIIASPFQDKNGGLRDVFAQQQRFAHARHKKIPTAGGGQGARDGQQTQSIGVGLHHRGHRTGLGGGHDGLKVCAQVTQVNLKPHRRVVRIYKSGHNPPTSARRIKSAHSAL